MLLLERDGHGEQLFTNSKTEINMLTNKTFLITGISGKNSLACTIAKEIMANNGQVICAGLGVTPFHQDLSDRSVQFLEKNYDDFEKAVNEELGSSVPKIKLDVSQEESVKALGIFLRDQGINVNGFLHAIAMDKTIRQKTVKDIIDVSAAEFCDTMIVSAYSLISISKSLIDSNVLQRDPSIVSLSYIAAERSAFHPYKNISIAKSALERITKELAVELGHSHNARVNAIRFSPFLDSKAGGATLTTDHFDFSNEKSPLGNATPLDLANEVLHLFSNKTRITGEVIHVDGGYHILG